MNTCTRKRVLSFLLISAAAFFPACRRERPEAAPPTQGTAPVEQKLGTLETWPVEVVDSLGRKVTVARLPERIVSLAPSNTEILFAVGAGRQVIGGTSFDNYPPDAKSIASIGGMTPKSINLEAVMALRPDLVLATSGVQEPIIGSLERLKLTVVALDATDFAGVARNIRLVGRLTGNTAQCRPARHRIPRPSCRSRPSRCLAAIARPKVLYLLWEDPVMTAGPGTFIGQMIEAAGGSNIFGDVTTRYPRPSEEEILARAPEVILGTYGDMNSGSADDEARRKRIRSRTGWAQIPAVRDNRIAFVDEDLITRPGPRLVEGLEAVAEVLDGDVTKSPEGSASGKSLTPR